MKAAKAMIAADILRVADAVLAEHWDMMIASVRRSQA